jgi:DNA-binding MarR family transcriptional regulator
MAKSKPPAQPDAAPDTPGRFSYDGLERAIHEKARLGIMTSLASHPDGLLFPELKDLCALTDGNLSRHLQVLHEEGLVEIWKGSRRKRPQTLCRLTPEGRRRFQEYIAVLENVIADALAASRTEADLNTRRTLAGGWSPA